MSVLEPKAHTNAAALGGCLYWLCASLENQALISTQWETFPDTSTWTWEPKLHFRMSFEQMWCRSLSHLMFLRTVLICYCSDCCPGCSRSKSPRGAAARDNLSPGTAYTLLLPWVLTLDPLLQQKNFYWSWSHAKADVLLSGNFFFQMCGRGENKC